jgi:hypothetical protein
MVALRSRRRIRCDDARETTASEHFIDGQRTAKSGI